MKTVIIIPYHLPFTWHADYYTKTVQLLSKKHIVFCFLWHDALSLKEHFLCGRRIRILRKIHKNLYAIYPVKFFPFSRFSIICKMNFFCNAVLLSIIIFFFELRHAVDRKILWIFSPMFYPLLQIMGPSYISLYDCVDYPDSSDKKEQADLLKNEENLVNECRLVTANSTALVHRLKKYKDTIILVPQGFRCDDVKHIRLLRDDRHKSTPTIGFVGGINDRLDYTLLRTLISRTPTWNYKFIGPFLEGEQCNALRSIPNVFWNETKDRHILALWIKRFDICIIPYDVRQPFNRYCYPMKLFEYFYMGKPVVSTPIEELKRFPKYVKIGKTANEWEKQIRLLLSKPWPKTYQKEERKLAIANSWERKISMILTAITEKNLKIS